MSRKILLLIIMSFLVAVGGLGVLNAQDPPQTPAASAETTQPDLSGTYTGTFNCEPLGLTGPTTLTITGNQFTTTDGKSGRIVASSSRGYIAVVLQVGGTETAPTTTPSTPVIVSLRGRKTGNRLILTPAPGATMQCSFTPGRGVARGRQRTPAATGTEVANPAATPAESPMPSPSPTPEASPTPSPEPVPSPSPTPEASPTPSPEPVPSPSPTPEASPEPVPSPTPSGSPSPVPSPTPTPTEPAPSPTASPTPTPTPTPRPF